MKFPPILFVTGTDTDVGKTFVSSILMNGLDAAYWKPIQAGVVPTTDTKTVQKVSGKPPSCFFPEQFCLSQAMSPHAAAEIDSVEIKLSDFSLPVFETSHLIIEGAGGLMVPINSDKNLVIDLIQHLKVPVLLVCRSGLGTLNHTLLSVEAMNIRGIEIFGLVMNGENHPKNKRTLEFHSGLPVIAEIPPVQSTSTEMISALFEQHFKQYA